jgi:hypothetical protein
METLRQFFTDTSTAFHLVKMLVPMFMAILFLQSGLDKVFHYKGNLDYFTAHFKNSPLSNTVGLLLPTITLLEMTAGVLSAIGVISLPSGNKLWAFWGLMAAAMALICLFFGQRVAKDYAGAVSLASYFAVVIIGLLLLL